MTAARRDWAFWVQALGLCLFWSLTMLIIGWFAWRGYELHRYGDSWIAAPVVGGGVSAVFVILASVLTYVFVKVGATAEGSAPELPIDPIELALTRGVVEPWSLRFKLVAGALAAVVVWSMYCWWVQIRDGLGVTGLDRPVSWGLYITNFVFFIGISHAGTLVSAILRLSNAEWRRAVTRAAEAITVLVLFVGAWNILLDMGRIDRIFEVFRRGRLQSPLLWDVCAISTYLTASTLYLYLPLIPDLALLRSRVHGWRRPLYHLFAFGWTGSASQKHALERAIGVMAVLVIPVAVSVHTVVAWVFSMTIQPMWHSTIFGPYFVVGAIFSGIAALLISMAMLRKGFRLEAFLRPVHFENLGILLMVMSCLWFYFTAAELVTVAYGAEPTEMGVFREKLFGAYAPLFWTMVLANFVLPMAILPAGGRAP